MGQLPQGTLLRISAVVADQHYVLWHLLAHSRPSARAVTEPDSACESVPLSVVAVEGGFNGFADGNGIVGTVPAADDETGKVDRIS